MNDSDPIIRRRRQRNNSALTGLAVTLGMCTTAVLAVIALVSWVGCGPASSSGPPPGPSALTGPTASPDVEGAKWTTEQLREHLWNRGVHCEDMIPFRVAEKDDFGGMFSYGPHNNNAVITVSRHPTAADAVKSIKEPGDFAWGRFTFSTSRDEPREKIKAALGIR